MTTEIQEREFYNCGCGWMDTRDPFEDPGAMECYQCGFPNVRQHLEFPLGAGPLTDLITKANRLDIESRHEVLDYLIVNELAALNKDYEGIPALYDARGKRYA